MRRLGVGQRNRARVLARRDVAVDGNGILLTRRIAFCLSWWDLVGRDGGIACTFSG